MRPPFDLNLMMTNEGREPQELIAKAEVARQLKANGSESNALALGWKPIRKIWTSPNDHVAGGFGQLAV